MKETDNTAINKIMVEIRLYNFLLGNFNFPFFLIGGNKNKKVGIRIISPLKNPKSVIIPIEKKVSNINNIYSIYFLYFIKSTPSLSSQHVLTFYARILAF